MKKYFPVLIFFDFFFGSEKNTYSMYIEKIFIVEKENLYFHYSYVFLEAHKKIQSLFY
jgi:hypothetical protein